MEAGDCPSLNINAMRAISVKSYLKNVMFFYNGVLWFQKHPIFFMGCFGI